MGFLHVGQADLKLLTSGDLPAASSQSAGITGVSHRTQPPQCILIFIYLFIYFSDRIFSLLSKLECRGTIIARCNLKLLDYNDPTTAAS